MRFNNSVNEKLIIYERAYIIRTCPLTYYKLYIVHFISMYIQLKWCYTFIHGLLQLVLHIYIFYAYQPILLSVFLF